MQTLSCISLAFIAFCVLAAAVPVKQYAIPADVSTFGISPTL